MRITQIAGGVLTMVCVGTGLACNGGPTAPTPPPGGSMDTAGVSPGPALVASESVLGLFRLTIDPTTCSASLDPVARGALSVQATQYDLDPVRFLRPDTLAVEAVRRTGLNDVEVTFSQAHPWPSPDLFQPASTTNRADLGYTGRLLILTDLALPEVAGHTFFGDVRAQTGALRNPDGYVRPGSLLHFTGFRANTFPYILLADEEKDNRVGLSNGSHLWPAYSTVVVEGRGSYDATAGGWQAAQLDTASGWTGYDFIHAGQQVRNTFTVSGDWLAGQSHTLDLALLVRYTEPKAVKGPGLRLPPATPDVLQFAYRAPHAALDVSKIIMKTHLTRFEYPPSDIVQLEEGVGKTAELFCFVRDWEALEPEAAAPDVGLDPAVDSIEPGTGGEPVVELSVPGLGPTLTALAVDDPAATGEAGDEIPYAGSLTNPLAAMPGPGPFADLPGLLRITDPETSAPGGGSSRYGLDPFTLAADVADALEPVTYQALTVRLVHQPPAWVTTVVDAREGIAGRPSLAILTGDPGTLADDHLAVAYWEEAQSNLMFAISTRLPPTGPGDWVMYYLDGLGGPETGHSPSLVVCEGRLALLYSNRTETRFARATVPVPLAVSDWQLSPLDTWGGFTFDTWQNACLLVDGTGRLAAAYAAHPVPRDDAPVVLRVARAQVPDPAGPADWLPVTVDNSVLAGPELRGAMAVHDGRLAVAYSRDTGMQPQPLLLARALSATPSSPTDWRTSLIDSHLPFKTSGLSLDRCLVSLNGRLMLLRKWRNMEVLQARVSEPDGPLDWTCTDTDMTSMSVGVTQFSLLSGDGRLTGLWQSGSDGWAIERALVPVPRHPADWQRLTGFQWSWAANAEHGGSSMVYQSGYYALAHAGEATILELSYNTVPLW